jgi:hypothetical protein
MIGSATFTAIRVAAAASLLSAAACKVTDPPPINAEWTDDFERSDIGKNYKPTANEYVIADGVLQVQGALNHPLWLRKKLPRDVVIELDVWGETPDGDLKVEVFGDGSSHAHNKGAYTSTGYVLCMGGWNNSKSFIARGSEHGSDMTARAQPRVVPGQRYHWKIVRQGGALQWFVDDLATPFLQYDDPEPYEGSGHEYFGFNNWQSRARFDNLKITPL